MWWVLTSAATSTPFSGTGGYSLYIPHARLPSDHPDLEIASEADFFTIFGINIPLNSPIGHGAHLGGVACGQMYYDQVCPRKPCLNGAIIDTG